MIVVHFKCKEFSLLLMLIEAESCGCQWFFTSLPFSSQKGTWEEKRLIENSSCAK